jgi:phytanoyl-CoA hydroxylase
MLTPEQIVYYHENGFLTVENVLSEAEVDSLRQVTDEFVEKSRAITENDVMYDLEPNHTADNPRLRRLKNPIEHHEVYDQIIRHESILGIVEQLIGKGLRTNGNKLNMKPPSKGSAVEWHQDWAFYPHTNDDILAVGIAIDDMTEENGCMLMVPGSHKTDLVSHHENGVFVGAVTEPNFKPDNIAKVLVKAGGISLHHARTLHASTPNHSQHPRRLLLFQYCSIDSWPLTGFADMGAYRASIIRGEPTYTPRMENVPVIIPLPKPDKAGSIFEIQDAMQNKEMAKQ